jgi:multimeric flavodoxin WrbA
MTKKVLVLSASPRKGGNSDTICDKFIEGAKSVGNTTEKIYVHEQKVNFCMACYACRQTKACVNKDNMTEILEKMVDADLIVLSTPVYFYTMDGQLKTMIDRTLPRYMDIKNKDFYFIATAAAGKGAMERTMDGLYGFTDCLPGAKVKGKIYGAGAWQKGDIQGNKAMQEAYEMGKESI